MSKRKTSENLKLAIFFFFFVGGIVFLSLIFRGIFLLKESKFDGSSHFTLQVSNQFISFSPRNSTVGILSVRNISTREIPVDAKIVSSVEISSDNLKPALFGLMFDLKNQKEINFVDILRLYLYTQTVKENSILQKELTDKTDKREVETILSIFFADPKTLEEKLNIEIINAIDVSGHGNRIANLVSSMGGNVILVSSGDIKKESTVQYTQDSYTTHKISQVLKVRKEKLPKKMVADVTIVIGEDHVR